MEGANRAWGLGRASVIPDANLLDTRVVKVDLTFTGDGTVDLQDQGTKSVNAGVGHGPLGQADSIGI